MKTPTPHPVITMPSDDWFQEVLGFSNGKEKIEEMLDERERRIALMRNDPLQFGHEPAFWEEIDNLWEDHNEVCLLGGNRGSKSEYAAKRVVKTLVNKPKSVALCYHKTRATSVVQQQSRIYQYLPPAWRRLKRLPGDNVTDISYTVKNGFTLDKFVTPQAAMCLFCNYSQEEDVIEGHEPDIIWFDEMVQHSLIETARFRMSTRNGIILTTFTPVKGYTATVASYVADARVVKSEVAELLDQSKVHVKGCAPGHMPRILACGHRKRAVACVFSKDNPFNNYDRLREELELEPESVKKIRAYGWAEKATAGVFSNFDESVHVISMEKWARMEAQGGLRICVADPSEGGKPWFIKWYLITPLDIVILYREWPGRDEFGAWAEASGRPWKWKPGEAWKAEANLSINKLKELCWGLEGQAWDEATGRWDMSRAEKIFERAMDPRLGGKESPGSDDAVSIISLCNEDVRERETARLKWPGMDWVSAPSSRIETSVEMVNDHMAYNHEAPITPLNTPRWFVVENCKHSILAYKEYCADEYGSFHQKCALKDIVDPDRYFVTSDYRYFEPGDLKPRGGGHW